MHNHADELTWKDIQEFLRGYRRNLIVYYPLPFASFCTLIVIMALIYALVEPVYTATAVIGPPNPSPIRAMMATMGPGGAMGLSRLAGAGASGSNDPFEEYMQLLDSSALARALATEDNFLPQIFYKRWDAKDGRWKEPTSLLEKFLKSMLASVKTFLQRPVIPHPGVDELHKYLQTNLTVESVQSPGARAFAFGSTGVSYSKLSFRADSPEKAERYLTTLLNRADVIIRQAQLRDVESRIAYIDSELPRITDVDQKNALVQTLANQEELKMMMVADKRFAYVLVSAPYASRVPTWPLSPAISLALALFMSICIWLAVVLVEPRLAFIQRALRKLKRPQNCRPTTRRHERGQSSLSVPAPQSRSE